MTHHDHSTDARGAPALIRWGAVLGGVILGISLMLLLATLWIALAFGAGAQAVEANLAWFMTGSAIIAMFAGGYLAGWLSGIPGGAPGFFNGLTVWGAILIGSLAIGMPGAMQVIDPAALTGLDVDVAIQGQALWAPFVSLLIGALAAGLGGVLGGMTTRPAGMYAAGAIAASHDHVVEEPRDERPVTRTERAPARDDEPRTVETAEEDPRDPVGGRTVELDRDEAHAADGRTG